MLVQQAEVLSSPHRSAASSEPKNPGPKIGRRIQVPVLVDAGRSVMNNEDLISELSGARSSLGLVADDWQDCHRCQACGCSHIAILLVLFALATPFSLGKKKDMASMGPE